MSGNHIQHISKGFYLVTFRSTSKEENIDGGGGEYSIE